jgi:hypothetical protein
MASPSRKPSDILMLVIKSRRMRWTGNVACISNILFNDAVIISDYAYSNDRITHKATIGKDLEGSVKVLFPQMP